MRRAGKRDKATYMATAKCRRAIIGDGELIVVRVHRRIDKTRFQQEKCTIEIEVYDN
jgi:hypothetical protein